MPSRSTLVRWGGLTAAAAGALYFLEALWTVLDYPFVVFGVLIGVLVRLLVLGGLVGLHARQVGSLGYGRLGTAGFLLAFVGGLLAAVLGPLVFSGAPGDVPPSFVDTIVTGAVGVTAELGMLLLGIATLRAAALPSVWKALPLAIFLLGAPFTVLMGPLFWVGIEVSILIGAQTLLLGIGWALLGYALWSRLGEGARLPVPARVR